MSDLVPHYDNNDSRQHNGGVELQSFRASDRYSRRNSGDNPRSRSNSPSPLGEQGGSTSREERTNAFDADQMVQYFRQFLANDVTSKSKNTEGRSFLGIKLPTFDLPWKKSGEMSRQSVEQTQPDGNEAEIDQQEAGIDQQLKYVKSRFNQLEETFYAQAELGDSVILPSEQLAFLNKFLTLRSIKQQIGEWVKLAKESVGDFSQKPKVIKAFKDVIKVFKDRADEMEKLITEDMPAALKKAQEKANEMERKISRYQAQNLCCVRIEATTADNGCYASNLFLDSREDAIKQKGVVEQDIRYMRHNYIRELNLPRCLEEVRKSYTWLNKEMRNIGCNPEHYTPPLKAWLQSYRRTIEDPQHERGDSLISPSSEENYLLPATDGTKGPPILEDPRGSEDKALKVFFRRYPDCDKDDESLAQALWKECERVAEIYDDDFKELEEVNDMSGNEASFYFWYIELATDENLLRYRLNGKYAEKIQDIESDIIKYETDVFRKPRKYRSDVSDLVSQDDLKTFLRRDLFYARQAAFRDEEKLPDYKQIRDQYQELAGKLAEREKWIDRYELRRARLRSLKEDTSSSLTEVLKHVFTVIKSAAKLLPNFPVGSDARTTRERELQQWKNEYERLIPIKDRLEVIADEWPEKAVIFTSKAGISRETFTDLQRQLFASGLEGMPPLDERPDPEALCQSYRDFKSAIQTFAAYSKDLIEELTTYKEAVGDYQSFKKEIDHVEKDYTQKQNYPVDTALKEVTNQRDLLWDWSQALSRSAKGDSDAQAASEKWQESLKIAEAILPEYPESDPKRRPREAALQQLKINYKRFLARNPEIVREYQEGEAGKIYQKLDTFVSMNEGIKSLIDTFPSSIVALLAANVHLNEYWSACRELIYSFPKIEDCMEEHPFFPLVDKEKAGFNKKNNQTAREEIESELRLLHVKSLTLGGLDPLKFVRYLYKQNLLLDDGVVDRELPEYYQYDKDEVELDSLIKDRENIETFLGEASQRMQKIKDFPIYLLYKEIEQQKYQIAVAFEQKKFEEKVLELTGMTLEQFSQANFYYDDPEGARNLQDLQQAVVYAAEQFGWKEVMETTKEIIRQVNHWNCTEIIDAIGKSGDESLADDLVNLFADEQVNVSTRLRAGRALCNLGGQSAARYLVEMLPNERNNGVIHNSIWTNLCTLERRSMITQSTIDRMMKIRDDPQTSQRVRKTINDLLRDWHIEG